VADELQIRDSSGSQSRKRQIAVTLTKPQQSDFEKVSVMQKRAA